MNSHIIRLHYFLKLWIYNLIKNIVLFCYLVFFKILERYCHENYLSNSYVFLIAFIRGNKSFRHQLI